jgi:hypothetical protein
MRIQAADDTRPLDLPWFAAYAAGMPDRHLPTRAAFTEELQQHAPTAWPAIWDAAYAHIEVCLETAYAELERLLAIPEMHRTRLRMEMRQVVRVIAEEGPEGPSRRFSLAVKATSSVYQTDVPKGVGVRRCNRRL